jgi:hypothetical protein
MRPKGYLMLEITWYSELQAWFNDIQSFHEALSWHPEVQVEVM